MRWVIIASLAALLFVTGMVIWQSRPERVIEKRQALLIDGIERRDSVRLRRLLAEDYRDRWDFNSDDAVRAIMDVGSQYMTLVLTPENESVVFEGDRAVVTAKIVVSGNPLGPVGNRATREVNQLEEPFVFTWEKQSFLPSSWRLVSVDNAGLPAELYGYKPGDIRRAMQGSSGDFE